MGWMVASSRGVQLRVRLWVGSGDPITGGFGRLQTRVGWRWASTDTGVGRLRVQVRLGDCEHSCGGLRTLVGGVRAAAMAASAGLEGSGELTRV